MPVQFKFRGEKAFRSLLNVTTPCTLQRVRSAIYEQARISDVTTDLSLEDAAAGGVLEAKALLVQDALVQVVVKRTPVQNRAGGEALALLDVPVVAGTAAAQLEEDLAIDRVIEQHDPAGIAPNSTNGILLRYSRSYRLAYGSRQRLRESGYDAGSDDEDALLEVPEPPPANYTCHRCGQAGGKPESHWIWECPTNEDPDHMKKVRTAKGIPRDFLRKVATIEEAQELSPGGVTFTLPGHSGHYILAHQSSLEDKKLRVGETVQEKVVTAYTDGAKRVGESLKCPLCHQMFRQATLSPCCGATFCGDCVIDRLAKSDSVENSRCPGCGKEVLAHQLISNEDIRKQVEEITRASKASALAAQRQQEYRPRAFEVNAALRDRVNRPRRHASSEALGSGAGLLALTDGSVAHTPAVDPATVASATAAAAAAAAAGRWQPLCFGPILTPEQFQLWKEVVRAGLPPQARQNFEEWRMHTLGAPPSVAPPPPSGSQSTAPPVPPSRESFEEWQRRARAGGPPAGASAGGCQLSPQDVIVMSSPGGSPSRDRKRSRDRKSVV